MFNHTKDVPFAAAMIGASCFLLRAVRDLPRPRMLDLMLFGLMAGAALGQRALGLFILAYVPLAILLHAPAPFAPRTALRFTARALLRFAPAFVLAYLIMIAAWLWSALSPLNPNAENIEANLVLVDLDATGRDVDEGSVFCWVCCKIARGSTPSIKATMTITTVPMPPPARPIPPKDLPRWSSTFSLRRSFSHFMSVS